jgi:adenosylcobyric acid synthase
MARALMILGTASHVGKSIFTAGLGRILADEGVSVAPFKAQNMSLNSAATPDEREIGRAQALQAEACRIAPAVEMNPVLIKPCSDTSSQVVLLGRVWRQVTAADYHTRYVEELFPAVLESYQKLAEQYEVVLLEGAGSPAEINLKEHDIVNLRMAKAANANCILVADIDRGGVFASLLGTMELLEPDERDLIRGFVINKFRGDKGLLEPGVKMIEDRISRPCLGVVPFLRDLGLDEEDGVALDARRTVHRVWKNDLFDSSSRPLRVGVVALPHMSNFTDFDPLAAEPSLAVAFVDHPEDVSQSDVLILPGSKQTIDDLEWLAATGFFPEIQKHRSKQRPIVGICGGFQMLGSKLFDPTGIENNGVPAECAGLDLLSVETIFHSQKTTRPIRGEIREGVLGRLPWTNRTFNGYEIHVGETRRTQAIEAFAEVLPLSGSTKSLDGAVSSDGLVFGCYIHGLFDDDSFRHSFVDVVRASAGLKPAEKKVFATGEREQRLDRWANHLRAHIDIDHIGNLLELKFSARSTGSAHL